MPVIPISDLPFSSKAIMSALSATTTTPLSTDQHTSDLPGPSQVVMAHVSIKTTTTKFSPKFKKILNKQLIISRLPKKLKNPSYLKKLRDKLTNAQYNFVVSQIKMSNRTRQWENIDKAFALKIYLQSPGIYAILRKQLAFPSKATLRRYTLNVAKAPGFCSNLLQCLSKASRKLKESEKLCVLVWDEMAIKSNLTYCERTDSIDGFETTKGDGQRLCATHALTFMAQGITKNWKQVLGYFFTASTSQNLKLKDLVVKAVEILHSCQFKVVATVCKQGPCNKGVYRDLGISTEKSFFFVGDNKVFVLYNPPHLLKSVCNDLKKHDIQFKEIKECNEQRQTIFASWNHIKDLYDLDSQQNFRVCPKLTKKHIDVPGLTTLNVKLASQVISNSVAAGLSVYSLRDNFDNRAVQTAEFIGTVNKMFDSVNSSSLHSPKEFGGALTNASGHIKFWEKMIQWIKTWEIISFKKKIVPASQKGWIITLRSLIGLWDSLKGEQLTYLLLNRFNQNCLEDTFSSVRRRGEFRDCPNCYHFRSTMHRVVIHNFLKDSLTKNCSSDGSQVLLDFGKFNEKELTNILEDSQIERNDELDHHTSIVIDLTIEAINFSLNIIEDNVLSCISGYLAQKFISLNDCPHCKELMLGDKILDSNTFLLYFKEYKEPKYGLKWPTIDLIIYMRALSYCILSNMDRYFYGSAVSENLCRELFKIQTSFLNNHDEHQTAAKNYFVSVFARMIVNHKVKTLNEQF